MPRFYPITRNFKPQSPKRSGLTRTFSNGGETVNVPNWETPSIARSFSNGHGETVNIPPGMRK